MPRSKKTSKLRVTGLCAGNSRVTGEFRVQRASNAKNVSIWWRHHDNVLNGIISQFCECVVCWQWSRNCNFSNGRLSSTHENVSGYMINLDCYTVLAWWQEDCLWCMQHGPLTRYIYLRIAHAQGMLGIFSPLPQVSDPDMHHGTCVTYVPWYIPG